MNNGFISLHRKITHHWIFVNPNFFKWWIIMLFEANYSDKKFNLGYALYDIKRGECANSLRTWANLFNCGTKQVTKFFDLLQKDVMIERKTIGKGKHSTTLININNYDHYQAPTETQGTTLETTQGKRKRHTTNKDNKDNKIYTPRQFYEKELKLATLNKNEYAMFIDILFGKNDLDKELIQVLKIKNQVTHKQFIKLLALKTEHKKSLAELLLNMENKPKSIRGNTSLYMTLRKWIQTNF